MVHTDGVDFVFDESLEGLIAVAESFDAKGLVVRLECSPLCVDVIGADGVDDVDCVFDGSLEGLIIVIEGFDVEGLVVVLECLPLYIEPC